MRAATLLLLSLLGCTSAARLRRQGRANKPVVPGLSYDPVDLLCKFKGGEQSWCRDWLTCIAENSDGQSEKVRDAWEPADCKEICGEWPAVTPTEGSSLLSLDHTASKKVAAISQLFAKGRQIQSAKDCMNSCENFQESLTTCVGTIMFEPGKLATMGVREDAGVPPPPKVCSEKGTHCLPDLPVRMQQCMSLKSKAYLKGDKFKAKDCMGNKDPACVCDQLKFDWEQCKSCPQMTSKGGSEYTTFVGGCMDQLNAYWQATHPDAGKQALPGATGCTVH